MRISWPARPPAGLHISGRGRGRNHEDILAGPRVVRTFERGADDMIGIIVLIVIFPGEAGFNSVPAA